MTKQIFWTREVLETFIIEGNLNERQEYILRARSKNTSIVKIACELNLSVDQINKDIANLKRLYDRVQVNNNILPIRKRNRIELYSS